MDAITRILAGNTGNADDGAKTFVNRCSSCHVLFGQGGTLGPELTGKERGNVPAMLLNIIDPSASLREGYTLFQVRTRYDQTLVGFVDERDATRIVLRDPAGQRTPVPLADI